MKMLARDSANFEMKILRYLGKIFLDNYVGIVV